MRDDLKTIWDEEHDFEEETEGEGAPEAAPAPEGPQEDQPTPETVAAAPEDPEALKAKQEAEKRAAEEARIAAEAAAQAKAAQETRVLVADVDSSIAEADANAALADAPVEAPKPLDPKEVLDTAFANILQDPAKIDGLKKVVEALGQEKLGADYASIPAPTDEFFKDAKNALLYNLLYIARFELTKKKPTEALATGESLTDDANMDKAIALLKEYSEAGEIKEDLQKIDLEEVKKTLGLPGGAPTPESPEPSKEKAGWFQDFFSQAAHGIALDLITSVNEEEAGGNDWLNLEGIQNKLLLMVLQLCTSLGGKEWYKGLREEDQTVLEKRFGLIRKEDGNLFEFGKPTDPNYVKAAETPVEPAPAPTPGPDPETETSQK